MSLTPDAIASVTFKRELRGYAELEVDVFLDRVQARLAELADENARLQQRVAAAEARATEGTEADTLLKRTLVLAQRTADEAIADARASADRALEEAQARADELVRRAEEEAERITVDAHARAAAQLSAARAAAQRTEREVAELQRFRAGYRERVHAAIAEQLALLEGHGDVPEISEDVTARARATSSAVAEAIERLSDEAPLSVIDFGELPVAEDVPQG